MAELVYIRVNGKNINISDKTKFIQISPKDNDKKMNKNPKEDQEKNKKKKICCCY